MLASFGLVALAGRCVVDLRCSPTELSSLIHFQIELLKLLDASGLCEGQDLDLRLEGDTRNHQRAKVNELKTVPLFDLAAQPACSSATPTPLPPANCGALPRSLDAPIRLPTITSTVKSTTYPL